MDHTSEGTLLAFLDDELTVPERAAVTAHLDGCGECAGALDALRAASERAAAALGWLDRPAPTEAAYAAVMGRAGVVPLGIEGSPSRERRFAGEAREPDGGAGVAGDAGAPGDRSGRAGAASVNFGDAGRAAGTTPAYGPARAWLRAAVLVLAFAGVAAAALPGSPVREWVGATWERTAALLGGGTDAPVAAAEEAEDAAVVDEVAETAAAPSGVSVLPAAGRVRIVFDAQDRESRIRVRLVDGERASVHAVAGHASPRYRTSAGRIHVVGGGRTEWLVELPASATAAVVEVDGRVMVMKEAGALRVLARDQGPADDDVLLRLDH